MKFHDPRGQNPCEHGPGELRCWHWWGGVARGKLLEHSGHLGVSSFLLSCAYQLLVPEGVTQCLFAELNQNVCSRPICPLVCVSEFLATGPRNTCQPFLCDIVGEKQVPYPQFSLSHPVLTTAQILGPSPRKQMLFPPTHDCSGGDCQQAWYILSPQDCVHAVGPSEVGGLSQPGGGKMSHGDASNSSSWGSRENPTG